ncbi:MAG: hypothetical protein N3B13_08960, partial [Deltaproteobacteria bacterium]|nr:hypothetical protein [Deltaproteobacteria bacterium]
MKRFFLAFLILSVFSSQALSQETVKDITGKKVLSVTIKGVSPGLQSDVLKLIPLKKGDKLDVALVRRSIKLIYKVYDIDNVEVYASLRGDGAEVVFEIVPSVFIRDVKIFGNENVSSLDIVRAMDFNKMSIFSKAQETTYIEKITQYLYSRGFRKAVVRTYTEKTDLPNVLNLFVIIEENERAVVGRSEIDVKDIRLKNIALNMLGLKEGDPLD